MLTNNRQDQVLFIFLSVWLLLGMIQTYFMDLSGEEAYYFLFSQNLDWGYMDHPPMVAFVTKIGYFLANNNLGARLMMTVLSTLTLLFVYRTYDKNKIDIWLFIYIAISLIGVHAGSFLIKTDVPLIFFEALFFWGYKKYLEKDNTLAIVILTVSIAGMLLSKYHGILIVFFVVLSNLELLKKRSFWIIVIGVVILMLPHTYWQYTHDWTSIKFHLEGRADMGFKWKNVFNYIISQPIVLGPITGFILLPVALMYKPINKFESALKFTLAGVLIFFFINSFRVYIHKHWTSIAMLPMMILGYYYCKDRIRLRAIIKYTSLITVLLVIPIRLYLSYDFIPERFDKNVETLHNWKQWGKELDSLAGKRNIVFVNSYENASRYSYLTGKDSHCLSTYYFNNTHFDQWKIEDTLQGKQVFLIDKRGDDSFTIHTTKIGEKIKYKTIDNYRSYAKVDIRITPAYPLEFSAKTTINIPIVIVNKHKYPVTIKNNPTLKPQLGFYFMQHYKTKKQGIAIESLELSPGETKTLNIPISTPQTPGEYQLRLGIQPGWIPATINSPFYKIKIK